MVLSSGSFLQHCTKTDKFLKKATTGFEFRIEIETWTLRDLCNVRRCIQKFPDWVDNEIYAYNRKHSL